MKRFKTNILNKIYTVASLFICASLVACSGISGVSDSASESSSASSNGMAYVSSISFGNSGRMIVPTGFNLMSDIEKFTLECAQQGEGTDLLTDNREWTGNEESGLSAYSVMFADITENRIIRYIQAKKVVIDCDQEMIYDVDGDEGSTFPVEIECLPGAVTLLTRKDSQDNS